MTASDEEKHEALIKAVLLGLIDGGRDADKALDALDAVDGNIFRRGGAEAGETFIAWVSLIEKFVPQQRKLFFERFWNVLPPDIRSTVGEGGCPA